MCSCAWGLPWLLCSCLVDDETLSGTKIATLTEARDAGNWDVVFNQQCQRLSVNFTGNCKEQHAGAKCQRPSLHATSLCYGVLRGHSGIGFHQPELPMRKNCRACVAPRCAIFGLWISQCGFWGETVGRLLGVMR